MARLVIQGITLLATIVLLVDATVMVSVSLPNGRKRSVSVQGLPADCQAEVDVEKRDNPEEIDFVVCVKQGKVCTSRDVSPCSGFAQACDSFKPPADKDFAKMFPKAYAQVCVEPSNGEQCLYTDVEYRTCEEPKIMNNNEICLTLSNGEVECSEIPEEYILQSMVQNKIDRVSAEDRLPQYHPDSVVQERLPQYRPTARVNQRLIGPGR